MQKLLSVVITIKTDNMFMGQWTENNNYRRSDVIKYRENHYICAISHVSSHIVVPSSEDIHWVWINETDFDWIRRIKDSQSDPELQIRKVSIHNGSQVPGKDFMSNRTKRKLDRVENEIERENKRIKNSSFNTREQILLLDMDISTKTMLLNKYDNAVLLNNGAEKAKSNTWLNTVLNLPFGTYKSLPVQKTDSPQRISRFLTRVRERLDKAVYGHDSVKDEILEYLAKVISNPSGRGQVLALCSSKGVGKTKLIKKGLAEALNFPFFQINFGGLNDVSVLTGHHETYVGSKPGKLVEILTKAKCMNPIIYLDEIDKISGSKAKDIFGILTHLLDPEQNHDFCDNYLSEISLDLSKVLFVLSFNDISEVDHIARDRMKVIFLDPPSIHDKIHICQNIMIGEICDDLHFEKYSLTKSNQGVDERNGISVVFSDEVLDYIIRNKVEQEDGVRQLRKSLESVLNKINLDHLLQSHRFIKENENLVKITKVMVDTILKNNQPSIDSHIYHSLYS